MTPPPRNISRVSGVFPRTPNKSLPNIGSPPTSIALSRSFRAKLGFLLLPPARAIPTLPRRAREELYDRRSMAPLSWRHHTLLQALLSRGPLPERDFHALFTAISGKDPGISLPTPSLLALLLLPPIGSPPRLFTRSRLGVRRNARQ